MRKKGMFIFIGFIFSVMCSGIAFAEDIGSPELPSLGIGRTVIEKGKYYIINEAGEPEENTGDEFNIYYDEKNDTLILKDADINSSFYIPAGTRVCLKGANTIDGGVGFQVSGTGDISIEGDGSVIITCSTEGILNSQGGLSISGDADITINAEAYAINLGGGI